MLFLVTNGPNYGFAADAVNVFRLPKIQISIAILYDDKNGRQVVLGQAKYVHDLIAVHADEGGDHVFANPSDKLATDRHPAKEHHA